MSQLQLSAEDLAKVQRSKARHETANISPEWMFTARFGYYFGWEGANAIMNDEIPFDVADTMLRGAEKIRSREIVDMANAVYVASVASRSKKGADILRKGMAGYTKNAKTGN